MMNSEIRTLQEQTREKITCYGNGYQMPAAPLCTAIETLLARQAEVLELLLTAPRPPMGPVHRAARILQDNPILDPQPAALAEEKKNG